MHPAYITGVIFQPGDTNEKSAPRTHPILRVVLMFVASVTLMISADTGAAGDTPGPLDYADPDNWLCRPEHLRYCDIDLSTTLIAADGEITIEPFSQAVDPEVDCFYIYPTASRDLTALSDTVPGENEEIAFVHHQFARLGTVCRLFAPIYRQRTLASAFGDAGPADERVTQDDVEAAWHTYLANDNQGRGVVLIGHSQGARLLRDLIRTRIDGKAEQKRILSAVLIGTDVTVAKGKDVGGDFQSMPLCHAPDQIGCIIVYASFRSNVPPGPDTFFGRIESYAVSRENSADVSESSESRTHNRRHQMELDIACTNPAALSGGSGPLKAYLPSIMYAPPFDSQPYPVPQLSWTSDDPIISTTFVSVPGLLSAQCVSNSNGTYLEVRVQGDPMDPRVDDILGDVFDANGRPMPDFGLHLIDVHLAMGNLVDIVHEQAAAYQASR